MNVNTLKDYYLWQKNSLSMRTKENIINLLKTNKAELSKMGVKDIGLFGSYVRNEQTEKSDIDLLIDFKDGQETYDNYLAVYDFVEALFKNKKVELLTMNGLSPYIGPQILKEVSYV